MKTMHPPNTKIEKRKVRNAIIEKAIDSTDLIQTQDDKTAHLIWWDGFIPKEQFLNVLPHQRINKIPGMDVLCYKSSTFKVFNQMRQLYPKIFNFFPMTYLLPFQFSDFQKEHIRLAAGSKKPITWIFKPRAGCSGNGIKIIQNSFEVSDSSYSGVVQKYVSPYLVDGYKFDFRLYIFIPTVEPFTVYIYKEGLARFCTTKYQPPTKANLSDKFAHLTNTAVNVENQESSVNILQYASEVLNKIVKTNPRAASLWGKIKYVVMLAMVAQYPQIIERINLQKNDWNIHQKDPEIENGIYGKPISFEHRFFHILGIDIMLNEKCDPIVLEMNDRPSMHISYPIEEELKTNLNLEALNMVTIDGSPPDTDADTGKWEKIMPLDESTPLGAAIKQIMDKSIQTVRNLSTVSRFYPRDYKIKTLSTANLHTVSLAASTGLIPKQASALPPLHGSTQ